MSSDLLVCSHYCYKTDRGLCHLNLKRHICRLGAFAAQAHMRDVTQQIKQNCGFVLNCSHSLWDFLFVGGQCPLVQLSAWAWLQCVRSFRLVILSVHGTSVATVLMIFRNSVCWNRDSVIGCTMAFWITMNQLPQVFPRFLRPFRLCAVCLRTPFAGNPKTRVQRWSLHLLDFSVLLATLCFWTVALPVPAFSQWEVQVGHGTLLGPGTWIHAHFVLFHPSKLPFRRGEHLHQRSSDGWELCSRLRLRCITFLPPTAVGVLRVITLRPVGVAAKNQASGTFSSDGPLQRKVCVKKKRKGCML